jgi:transcription initiation factor TFIIIB Brf1 subunit/transcription initiation factor TFIIB
MATFIVLQPVFIEMKQENVPPITPVKCPDCNSQLVNSGNELVCSKCGLVVDFFDKYVASYDQGQTVQSDSCYGSLIAEHGFKNGISRMQKKIFYSATRKENELKWIIDKICSNFHLGPSIRQFSHSVGLALLHNSKSRKNNLAAVATYSVVSAARSCDLNIVPHYKKIQAYLRSIGFKIRPRDLFNVISVAREIGIAEAKYDMGKTVNEVISLMMTNNRKLQTLGEKEAFLSILRLMSIRFFNDLKSKHYYFHGKNPMICLAAAIYAASKEAAAVLKIKNPVTQRELAGYVGYAEYSVRETYEEFFGKASQPVKPLSTVESCRLTVL